MTLEPWLVAMIIIWAFIILALALVIARALRRQRRIRAAYIAAMEQHALARAVRLQNDALLYHPTLSPRGLTKEEVDIAAPLSVTIPDAVFLHADAARAAAVAEAPPPPEPAELSFASSLAFSEVNLDAATCSICLDDIAVGEKKRVIKRCGHAYHSKCIRNWLRRENKCPNCQQHALEQPARRAAAVVARDRERQQMRDLARARDELLEPRAPRPVEPPRRTPGLGAAASDAVKRLLARKRTAPDRVDVRARSGAARISYGGRALRERAARGTLLDEGELQFLGDWEDEVDIEAGLDVGDAHIGDLGDVAGERPDLDVEDMLSRMNTV